MQHDQPHNPAYHAMGPSSLPSSEGTGRLANGGSSKLNTVPLHNSRLLYVMLI
jgi:hypothetical protein